MKTPEIDLVHQAGNWPETENLTRKIEEAIGATVKTAKLSLPLQAELCVVLSDDAHLQSLNNQWRKVDRPTNVLSFPSVEIEPGEQPESLMGDIIIARETTEREALEQEKPFDNHLVHLVIHGFLHIYGYDHVDDNDADIMEELECQCMNALGLPDPYKENT